MGLTLSCQESVLASPKASDPLAKFLLLIPMTLCSASLELLGQRGKMLSLQDKIMISLDHELKLPPSQLRIPQTSESTGKEESYCAGWSD